MTSDFPPELLETFQAAVVSLERRFEGKPLGDEDVDRELRSWLDGHDSPLPWLDPTRGTADEWFFVTTLYGEMSAEGQRSHIRKFFPLLFVHAADRDIRNFVPDMLEFAGLRSGWMKSRLCRMGEILRERGLTMEGYAEWLRDLDAVATPANPMPALDAIVRDHRATGWKTLSVFVRDYVRGNSFPIDTRVLRELRRHGLPEDERLLVRLSLALERNPRTAARMFYEAGASSGGDT